jgi:hypothetical protein
MVTDVGFAGAAAGDAGVAANRELGGGQRGAAVHQRPRRGADAQHLAHGACTSRHTRIALGHQRQAVAEARLPYRVAIHERGDYRVFLGSECGLWGRRRRTGMRAMALVLDRDRRFAPPERPNLSGGFRGGQRKRTYATGQQGSTFNL